MKPKPAHLAPKYGAQFGDAAVVAAYTRRPPYAPQTFDHLLTLMTSSDGRILDVGCGRGDLAIPLAGRGPHVDAVDPSTAMLASGKARPGGDAANLNWIHGPIETAPLSPPYALATAGQSLHWTEWELSVPRIASALAQGAHLALVSRTFETSPWNDALLPLIAEHSTNREYEPYVLVDELTSRGLFVERGRFETEPRVHSQSLADFVESFHSANGFSRDRMPAESAREFDAAVAALVRSHIGDAPVELETGVQIIWGTPRRGAS